MASYDRNDTLQKIVDLIVKELKIDPSTVKVMCHFKIWALIHSIWYKLS